MLPQYDLRVRGDVLLIDSQLQAIRTQALELVAAIDDLRARSEHEPPTGWVPGEQDAPPRGPSL